MAFLYIFQDEFCLIPTKVINDLFFLTFMENKFKNFFIGDNVSSIKKDASSIEGDVASAAAEPVSTVVGEVGKAIINSLINCNIATGDKEPDSPSEVEKGLFHDFPSAKTTPTQVDQHPLKTSRSQI